MTTSKGKSSRRDFIAGSSTALGLGWLSLHAGEVMAAAQAARTRQEAAAPFKTIGPKEGRVLGAVADQIWPQDDSPGGRELGAVYFMDYAVSAFMAGAWPGIQAGIADLESRSQAAHGRSFADLDFDTQRSTLKEVENSAFFGISHFLIVTGCFALPEYGGNRNGGGWDQIGFTQQHVWSPPFGHYDAQYTRDQEQGDV